MLVQFAVAYVSRGARSDRRTCPSYTRRQPKAASATRRRKRTSRGRLYANEICGPRSSDGTSTPRTSS